MKKCKRCGLYKKESEYERKHSRYLHPYCDPCRRILGREYHHKKTKVFHRNSEFVANHIYITWPITSGIKILEKMK